jgi:hypothetical protein
MWLAGQFNQSLLGGGVNGHANTTWQALGCIQSAVVCSQLLCCAVLCCAVLRITHWV